MQKTEISILWKKASMYLVFFGLGCIASSTIWLALLYKEANSSDSFFMRRQEGHIYTLLNLIETYSANDPYFEQLLHCKLALVNAEHRAVLEKYSKVNPFEGRVKNALENSKINVENPGNCWINTDA